MAARTLETPPPQTRDVEKLYMFYLTTLGILISLRSIIRGNRIKIRLRVSGSALRGMGNLVSHSRSAFDTAANIFCLTSIGCYKRLTATHYRNVEERDCIEMDITCFISESATSELTKIRILCT